MAITLALPLIVLAMVEGLLRLGGWGGYPAFIRVAGHLPNGASVAIVEPAASKPYFFANPTRPGYAEETSFLMPKPEGTVRIFLVGESAAKGYPQPRNLSMQSFLQEMLGDAWPDRKVEVISLGTTAVASFPLVYLTREALRYDPDLMVLYVGNNEFFGAYGVASINSFGTLPSLALPAMRAFRGLALVQAIEGTLRSRADEDRTLMEQMIGNTSIPPASPLRDAAARNLEVHVGRMIDATVAAGVPVLVCTTASNESGLAPLGESDEAARAFAEARHLAQEGPKDRAREAFLRARDLDPMPWRPITGTEAAIRRAATTRNAALCDVATVFRDMSDEGAAGWDLLDDHVHLSLRGQAEAARAMVGAMAALPAAVRVDPARASSLPDWQTYAKRLGTNEWDDYRVHHTLRVLFGVPFMKRHNPEALARFEAACTTMERRMTPPLAEIARQWQSFKPHAGGLRPLTGMVARELLKQNKTSEAERLYAIARRQVPDYTSWYLEYVYFMLACRERIGGGLSEADRDEAARAIDQGRFLLAHGFSSTGFTERYVGRLHQLRGEWAESIPFLRAARPKLATTDLVACDQALVEAYRHTGDLAAARAIIEQGQRESRRFADAYRTMEASLIDSATPPPPSP